MVQGSGFKVRGSGFRAQGSGFRVHDSNHLVAEFLELPLRVVLRGYHLLEVVEVTLALIERHPGIANFDKGAPSTRQQVLQRLRDLVRREEQLARLRVLVRKKSHVIHLRHAGQASGLRLRK